MKGKIFSAVLLLGIALNAYWDMQWQTSNEIGIAITNYGIIGHDEENLRAGTYWPAGYTNETYLYGSGLWVGALVDTFIDTILNDTLRDTLVSYGYNPNTSQSVFSPGDGSDVPLYNNPADIVYINGRMNNGFPWPLKKTNGNDSIIAQSESYAVFSDLDSTAGDGGHTPLGIKVIQQTFAWDEPFLNNILFIKYSIINERADGKDIGSCYLGGAYDFDIGNETADNANDLLGFIDTMTTDFGGAFDTLVHISTGYQFQTDNETGWAHKPAIPTMTLLQTPAATDSIDLYHNGSFYILPGEDIGLTGFNRFELATDPVTPQERYQVLAGYNHIIFNPSDPEASYAPFPSWGLQTTGYPGQNESQTMADDKRYVMSCGPFNLAYMDTVEYVIALCMDTTPKEIVPNALSLLYFWNTYKDRIALINPIVNETVCDSVNFTWSCDTVLDSFRLILSSEYLDTSIFVSGTNTGNAYLNTMLVPDGFYRWHVWNYDSIFLIAGSENRMIQIDNPLRNGKPHILSLRDSAVAESLHINWIVEDPDNDTTMNYIYFIRQSNNDTLKCWTKANILHINAYTTLPSDSYSVVMISVDDSLAADTAQISIVVDLDRPFSSAAQSGGSNNTVDIDVLVYNRSKVKYNNYTVEFGWPLAYTGVIRMPFNVIDNTEARTVLIDTVDFSDNTFSQEYLTGIFDGIGLRLNYSNQKNQLFDSLLIITDPGTLYPESLLEYTLGNPVYSGRNIQISWHTDGDSVFADFVCDSYTSSIPYNPNYLSCNYFFGASSDKSSYLNANSSAMTVSYISGGLLYFNKPGRAYPMDTLWFPEEGEIWKIFCSGDRIPVYGDIYQFVPSGITKKEHINNMSFITKKSIITDRLVLEFTDNISEDIDLKIYDIQGRMVDKFEVPAYVKTAGRNLSLSSGIYFIQSPQLGITRKFLLIR